MNIATVYEVLGDAKRFENIPSATLPIALYLNIVRGCLLDTFVRWWLMEDTAEAVRDFIQRNIAYATLVEQQGGLFRYHLPRDLMMMLPSILVAWKMP